MSGPQARVEILIDRWGVPHVYATSPYDAFFAQGFNAARDRLWQIDLWRRSLIPVKGGESAEVELRFTRHGPVIYEDPENNVAFAVKAAWLEPGTALFEVWHRLQLREALLTRALEGIVGTGRLVEAVARVMQVEDQAGDARMDLEVLEKLDARLGPEAVDEVMLSSLRDATERLEGLLGADRGQWSKLHHAFLDQLLSPLVERRTRERLDVGPAPRGGSGDTVGNAAYRLEDFRQTGGSSWRVVVDVGGWDNSLIMNSPGQSGDPASPHYSDLFRPWARDEAVPLLYSRRKVEAAAERRIVLEPKAR